MLTGPVEGTLLQFLVWTTNARRVLEIFSDPSTEMPQSAAGTKGANGAASPETAS